jgi:hypothetical protein
MQMIRNLKVLGLALVAVFAMSAVAAGAASAEKYAFHSAGPFTTLTGTQAGATNDVFTTDGGKVTCNTATYHGTIEAEETTTISLAPTYSSCTLEPFGSAVVSTNGCTYLIHAETRVGENDYTTNTDIVCPAGKEITVVGTLFGTTKCTIHIPAQNLGTGITVTNATSAGGVSDIQAHISFSNIKYTETAGSGFGACTSTSGTANGAYSGFATISGDDSIGEPLDIWAGAGPV